MKPFEIFEKSIETLREQYSEHRFKLECDVVEAVRLQMVGDVKCLGLPYQVCKEFAIDVSPGKTRRADLAIVSGSSVELVAEFKYEPSHNRHQEFSNTPSKFPVVEWKCVLNDVQRAQNFVCSGQAKIAYSIFIDEGSHFSREKAPPGSEWRPWENDVSILWYVKDGSVRNQ